MQSASSSAAHCSRERRSCSSECGQHLRRTSALCKVLLDTRIQHQSSHRKVMCQARAWHMYHAALTISCSSQQVPWRRTITGLSRSSQTLHIKRPISRSHRGVYDVLQICRVRLPALAAVRCTLAGTPRVTSGAVPIWSYTTAS